MRKSNYRIYGTWKCKNYLSQHKIYLRDENINKTINVYLYHYENIYSNLHTNIFRIDLPKNNIILNMTEEFYCYNWGSFLIKVEQSKHRLSQANRDCTPSTVHINRLCRKYCRISTWCNPNRVCHIGSFFATMAKTFIWTLEWSWDFSVVRLTLGIKQVAICGQQFLWKT